MPAFVMTASLKQCDGSTAFTIYADEGKLSRAPRKKSFGRRKYTQHAIFSYQSRKAKECGHAWLPKDALLVVVPNWPATGSGERTQGTWENEKKKFIELRIGNGVFDPTFHFPF